MSCFDLMLDESEQYFRAAGLHEDDGQPLRENAHNPTEMLCNGAILNLFSQRAKGFCQKDDVLETELMYVGHAREKMGDLVKEVAPDMVDAHFYELVEEAAMEHGVTTDDPSVISYFANRDRHLMDLLGVMFGYDLTVFDIKDQAPDTHNEGKRTPPPSAPPAP
ncbi:MAG: hypothetical protein AB7E85_01850 [Pseudobdellovibrionaceae bacterium]